MPAAAPVTLLAESGVASRLASTANLGGQPGVYDLYGLDGLEVLVCVCLSQGYLAWTPRFNVLYACIAVNLWETDLFCFFFRKASYRAGASNAPRVPPCCSFMVHA